MHFAVKQARKAERRKAEYLKAATEHIPPKEIAPRSTAILEKLAVAHLAKNFHALY
jgi:hypothetical protein